MPTLAARPVVQAARSCPVCGDDGKSWRLLRDYNRRLSNDLFEYRRCVGCGTVFLRTPPVDIGRFYEDSDYYALPSSPRDLELQSAPRQEMVHIIQRFVKSGRLLDIGPGHGLFAYRAKKSGFDVEAIEMDRRCTEYLNSTLGIPTVCSSQPEQALEHLGRYDVISLLHALEHLPAPIQTLRAVAQALNVKGILIVAMPSVDSLQFKILGKFWAHLDAPRHFQLISRARLTEFAERMGFKEMTVTSSDSIGLSANSFGWRRSLANLSQTKLGKRVWGNLGKVLEVVFQRFEGMGLRGSTFTAVYRKVTSEDPPTRR